MLQHRGDKENFNNWHQLLAQLFFCPELARICTNKYSELQIHYNFTEHFAQITLAAGAAFGRPRISTNLHEIIQ
jgi:hypothetical protein